MICDVTELGGYTMVCPIVLGGVFKYGRWYALEDQVARP